MVFITGESWLNEMNRAMGAVPSLKKKKKQIHSILLFVSYQ